MLQLQCCVMQLPLTSDHPAQQFRCYQGGHVHIPSWYSELVCSYSNCVIQLPLTTSPGVLCGPPVVDPVIYFYLNPDTCAPE